MRGIGSYSFSPQVERKPGVVLLFRGNKAVVRFHDGATYGLPAKLLRSAGLREGHRFVMIIARVGKEVRDVRVEPVAEARRVAVTRATPKIIVRDGKKLITRKRQDPK